MRTRSYRRARLQQCPVGSGTRHRRTRSSSRRSRRRSRGGGVGFDNTPDGPVTKLFTDVIQDTIDVVIPKKKAVMTINIERSTRRIQALQEEIDRLSQEMTTEEGKKETLQHSQSEFDTNTKSLRECSTQCQSASTLKKVLQVFVAGMDKGIGQEYIPSAKTDLYYLLQLYKLYVKNPTESSQGLHPNSVVQSDRFAKSLKNKSQALEISVDGYTQPIILQVFIKESTSSREASHGGQSISAPAELILQQLSSSHSSDKLSDTQLKYLFLWCVIQNSDVLKNNLYLSSLQYGVDGDALAICKNYIEARINIDIDTCLKYVLPEELISALSHTDKIIVR